MPNGRSIFLVDMFVLGDSVSYDGISGVIDFIGSTYITIGFPSYNNNTQKWVKLVVYRSDYKKVITSRQSEK